MSDRSSDTTFHGMTAIQEMVGFSDTHRIPMYRATIPVAADVHEIHLSPSDGPPNPFRPKRPAAPVADMTPSEHCVTRNSPCVAESNTRKITSGDQLADTLGRHTQ